MLKAKHLLSDNFIAKYSKIMEVIRTAISIAGCTIETVTLGNLILEPHWQDDFLLGVKSRDNFIVKYNSEDDSFVIFQSSCGSHNPQIDEHFEYYPEFNDKDDPDSWFYDPIALANEIKKYVKLREEKLKDFKMPKQKLVFETNN